MWKCVSKTPQCNFQKKSRCEEDPSICPFGNAWKYRQRLRIERPTLKPSSYTQENTFKNTPEPPLLPSPAPDPHPPPRAGPPSSPPRHPPSPRRTPSPGPHKISLFFSVARIFFLSSSWGSSGGILVVFLKAGGPEMCTFGLSGCRVKPPRPRGIGAFDRIVTSPGDWWQRQMQNNALRRLFLMCFADTSPV